MGKSQDTGYKRRQTEVETEHRRERDRLRERERERRAGGRELLCVDSYISLLGEIHLLELARCSSV